MQVPVRHIFLDMDGVLADFVAAALMLHGRGELLAEWPLGQWDVHAVLGISSGAFWGEIDQRGADFWADLAPFPWMFELVDQLREVAPVTIASSPSYDPACLEGKIRWLQKHFGRRFRDFMIGPRKHLLARPDTALIDDSDRNIRDFREQGGQGVLFPQPWNSGHDRVNDRLGAVLRAIRPPEGRP